MKTIESLDRLSAEELARIRQTLRRRYRWGRGQGVMEIGFGIAERDSQLDPSRQDAICFLVTRKRSPRAKRERIPAIEEVRLRRGEEFVRVRLPTDVVQAEPSRLRLTRLTVRHEATNQTATASGLIAWRVSEAATFAWGVITVGHPFWHVRQVPEAGRGVGVLVPDASGTGSHELTGRLIARTGRRGGSGVDAALVEVSQRQLLEAGWVSPHEAPPSLTVRPASALPTDVAREGISLTSDGEVPFTVVRYYPRFSLIAEVGLIRDVLEVESPYAATYAPGRSGTLWQIDGETACLQFAGWLHPTVPALSYRRGLGQAFEAVLRWAKEQLAAKQGVTARDLELHFTRRL